MSGSNLSRDEYDSAHQDWFDNGVVLVKLLTDFRDRKSDALDSFIESKVVNDFSQLFGATVESASVGNNPRYDVRLHNGLKIEVKISTYISDDDPKKIQERIFVETGHQSMGVWSDSGLLLTESDYYMLLTPGIISGKIVMKVRVIPTDILRMIHQIKGSPITINNSRGFTHSTHDLEYDGWIGSYSYDPDTKCFDSTKVTVAGSYIKALKATAKYPT